MNELALRIAPFLQPVGVDQPRRVIVGVLQDRLQKSFILRHEANYLTTLLWREVTSDLDWRIVSAERRSRKSLLNCVGSRAVGHGGKAEPPARREGAD